MELGQELSNFNLDNSNTALIINQAATVLQQGGIILFPCDTVWGLLCSDLSSDSVFKLNRIKQRDVFQPIAVLNTISSKEASIIWQKIYSKPIIRRYFPGKLTVIVPLSLVCFLNSKYQYICSTQKEVGIRIVTRKHPIENLIKTTGTILATSANIHNQPLCSSLKEISSEITSKVDYIANIDINVSQKSSAIFSTITNSLNRL